MKTITIANAKGGVGKTTTANNVAYQLAVRHNKRVLLMDLDSQCNTTLAFLNGRLTDREMTMYELLEVKRLFSARYGTRPKPQTLSEIAIPDEHWLTNGRSESGLLHLAPASLELSVLEISLKQYSHRPSFELAMAVKNDENLHKDYDYLVIDCPPAWTMLTTNAAAITDLFLFPIEIGSVFSLSAIQIFFSYLTDVVEDINEKRFSVAGIVNKYDARTKSSKDNLAAVESVFRQSKFDIIKPILNQRAAIMTAYNEFMPISSADPTSDSAKSFELISDEVLKRV